MAASLAASVAQDFSDCALISQTAISNGGGGGGGACDTSRQSEASEGSGYTVGFSTVYTYLASKITAAASYDACQLQVPLQRVGSPTFTMTFEVWSHDAGNDQPDALVGSGDTLDAASVSTDEATYSLDVSASLSSGATYWLLVRCDPVGDAGNHIVWMRQAAGAVELIKHSTDTSTWSTTSSTRCLAYNLFSQ